MPFPSKFNFLSPFASLSIAASGSMHFSEILLFERFRDSTYDVTIALAKCCTPESVILFPLRSISCINPQIVRFLFISFIYWSPIPRPDKLRQPSIISVLNALPIADSFETCFTMPAGGPTGDSFETFLVILAVGF